MIEKKPMDIKELKKFGYLVGSIFFLAFGMAIPWVKHRHLSPPFILIGLALLFLATFLPLFLSPIMKVWLKAGDVLGKINTRIILSFVFFIVVFPIGLLLKLFGKNLIHLKMGNEIDSYRIKSAPLLRESIRRPF